MAISLVGTGSVSSHADTVTPAYPGGAAANQLALLQVASAHEDDSVPSTPSGWTQLGTASGGTGSFTDGSGARRLTWFTRVLAGSDAAPTTAIPSGTTGSVITGRIMLLSRSAGTGWRFALSFGADAVSDTSFSALCDPAITFTTGDFVMLGYSVASDTATMSAEAITAAGVTFGTVTERADDGTATGFNVRNVQATCAVTTGTASAIAPTVAGTLSAAKTGVGGVLRVRESTAALAVTAQTVFPPRNLISATNLAADDIVTATFYRVVATARTPVRAATDVDVTGQQSLLRVDGEQPFGVAVSYTATLTDLYGSEWEITTGTITSTVTSDVISDAVQGIGAAVNVQEWPEKARTREATSFNVGGRIVVVSRPRSAASATVVARTDTQEAGDALQAVLDGATGGVVQVRKRVSMEGIDEHVAVLSDSEDRTWYNASRRWQLEVVEVEAWPDELEAAGFTLQDIADNYTSLQDIADDNATLLILAQRSF